MSGNPRPVRPPRRWRRWILVGMGSFLGFYLISYLIVRQASLARPIASLVPSHLADLPDGEPLPAEIEESLRRKRETRPIDLGYLSPSWERSLLVFYFPLSWADRMLAGRGTDYEVFTRGPRPEPGSLPLPPGTGTGG